MARCQAPRVTLIAGIKSFEFHPPKAPTRFLMKMHALASSTHSPNKNPDGQFSNEIEAIEAVAYGRYRGGGDTLNARSSLHRDIAPGRVSRAVFPGRRQWSHTARFSWFFCWNMPVERDTGIQSIAAPLASVTSDRFDYLYLVQKLSV